MMMKNNMTTIYVVRHGESEFNRQGDKKRIKQSSEWGELQAPLSKNGQKQAQERAEQFKGIHFDAIFSSDLTRAKQTAEIINLQRKLIIQTKKILRERSVYFPGKSLEENEKEMKEMLMHLDEKQKMAFKPNATIESAEEVASRIVTFLKEIAVTYKNGTILVINHGNNMQSLLTHLGYANYDELPHGSIDNTGSIILECNEVDFFIKETFGIHRQKNAKRGW
jgi:probable phosphoglycerate mutase